MTRFLDKSFSVHAGTGQSYRDNWDRIFKKDADKASKPACHICWDTGHYYDVPNDLEMRCSCGASEQRRPEASPKLQILADAASVPKVTLYEDNERRSGEAQAADRVLLLETAIRAILATDERGQGVLFKEAMDEAARLVPRPTPSDASRGRAFIGEPGPRQATAAPRRERAEPVHHRSDGTPYPEGEAPLICEAQNSALACPRCHQPPREDGRLRICERVRPGARTVFCEYEVQPPRPCGLGYFGCKEDHSAEDDVNVHRQTDAPNASHESKRPEPEPEPSSRNPLGGHY